MTVPLHSQPLALGTMAMMGCYGHVEKSDAIETIHAFLDAGQTYIDTADLYGDGAGEVLVGQTIRSRRDEVTLCTKFGFKFGISADQRGLDARPERVEPACDASLSRLGVEQIDLYYLHRLDPNVRIADTMGAMKRLVEKGKVRELGLCEVSRSSLRQAMDVHPVAAIQSEYSLWSRDPEEDILDACRELDIKFFGYAPLGRGFLTGQIKSLADIPASDQRREYPRFIGENFIKNLSLVEEVRAQASELGVTPAQLSLAWVLRTRQVIPVVGATSKAQTVENLGALSIDLSPGRIERLEKTLPVGDRYPTAAMKRLERSSRA